MSIAHLIFVFVALIVAIIGIVKAFKAMTEPVKIPANRGVVFVILHQLGAFSTAFTPWMICAMILAWVANQFK